MPPRTRRRTANVAAPRRRTSATSEGETVGDALIRDLQNAAAFTAGDQVAPCAILWPDGERRWAGVIGALQEKLPALFALGTWQPEDRSGPAIWLRCVEARVSDPKLPAGVTPIFYLPGVSAEALRQTEECSEAIAPLVELQFRGAVWQAPNGRDWTPLSWLASLAGVEVITGRETDDAVQRALPRLLDEPLTDVRRIDAETCHALVAPDMPAQLLRWLQEPANFRKRADADGWAAFREQCRGGYDFDPEKDGEHKAAELLATRHGAWGAVWQRFAEAPRNYGGVVALLRKVEPQLSDTLETSPRINERDEGELAVALAALANRPADAAAEMIRALGATHAKRRDVVWRQIGEAQLAVALEPLERLVALVTQPCGGANATELAQIYAEAGWQVDAAAIEILQACENASHEAPVAQALRAIYQPWLDRVARTLQMLLRSEGSEPARRLPPPALAPGRVVLFADGLRMDVARLLASELGAHGLTAACDWDWSPLPSVTASAKPWASPLAEEFIGGAAEDEFAVTIRGSGQRLTQPRFVELLGLRGWQVLDSRETGDVSGSAWTECGTLDKDGHHKGWRLAQTVRNEVRTLAERVRALLAAGWREVMIVTDHGWLLLPEGLPKTELKGFLAVHRWGRCAALKETATPDLPLAPWRWNRAVTLAFPPGIGCFVAGTEYAHGGISPQELVVPRLTVQQATAGGNEAAIKEVKWNGATCKVTVTGATAGCALDLRRRTADPASSLLVDRSAKALASSGSATLYLGDDGDLGSAAVLVLLDLAGAVLQARTLTLGENI